LNSSKLAEDEILFTDWNYRLNYFRVDIRKSEAIIINYSSNLNY